jgi:hypothetical protein
MKRLLCVSAFALFSTAAFAQTEPSMVQRMGGDIYFRPGSGLTTEATGLVDLLTRALDKSRTLHRVDVADDASIELEAPTDFKKDADGRVTIRFELTPAGGGNGSRSFTATCTVTQMDRCTDAIVVRAERMARGL